MIDDRLERHHVLKGRRAEPDDEQAPVVRTIRNRALPLIIGSQAQRAEQCHTDAMPVP